MYLNRVSFDDLILEMLADVERVIVLLYNVFTSNRSAQTRHIVLEELEDHLRIDFFFHPCRRCRRRSTADDYSLTSWNRSILDEFRLVLINSRCDQCC